MNKLILITGGTGFIGSHTCIELIKKGYYLLVVDSLINSSLKVVEKIRIILNCPGENLDDHLMKTGSLEFFVSFSLKAYPAELNPSMCSKFFELLSIIYLAISPLAFLA